MTLATAFGFFGHALLLAVTAALLVRNRITSGRSRLVVAVAVVALAAVPLGGLPALAYLRGGFGDLSITTVALLALALVRNVSGRMWMPERDRWVLLAGTGLVALLFYPLALGLGPFDPYAAGFTSPLMVGALALLFAAALWRGLPWVAAIILLGVAGWLGGVLESSNLWDYLLDPLVAVYAVIDSVGRVRARLRGSVQTQ